jgi:hypothetical protein
LSLSFFVFLLTVATGHQSDCWLARQQRSIPGSANFFVVIAAAGTTEVNMAVYVIVMKRMALIHFR